MTYTITLQLLSSILSPTPASTVYGKPKPAQPVTNARKSDCTGLEGEYCTGGYPEPQCFSVYVLKLATLSRASFPQTWYLSRPQTPKITTASLVREILEVDFLREVHKPLNNNDIISVRNSEAILRQYLDQ